MVLAATASLHLWYAMEWCFLRSVDSGMAVFWYTASLSQNTLAEQSMGTPNIRNLYLNASVNSTATFIAQNSAPNVLVSTEGWRLLNQ